MSLKHKKLYRLPAFLLAVVLMITNIPFANVNAAGNAGTQEMAAEENAEEETISENETEEEDDGLTGESLVGDDLAALEETVEEKTEGETEEATLEEDEETAEAENTETENIATKETLDKAEETEATCQLIIHNGFVSGVEPISEETDGKKIYEIESGGHVYILAEGEGYFEGWYDENGECLTRYNYYQFTITENRELTAKWNENVVSNNLVNASYSFNSNGGAMWSVEDGNVLKGDAYSSTLVMNLNIPEGGGILEFEYRTSSEEDADKFIFYDEGYNYDGCIYTLITESGETEYKKYAMLLEEGEQTLYFQYQKDGNCDAYEDCVYVKNITLKEDKKEEVDITVQTNIEESASLVGAGKYPYGKSFWLAVEEMPEGYVFMGWFDSEENLLSYNTTKQLTAMEKETYTAKFITEEEYKKNFEGLIAGNNGTITVTDIGDTQLLIPENGAIVKKNGAEGYETLKFKVTGTVEGTKYLNFDIYDPKDAMAVSAKQEGNDTYTTFSGTRCVKNCSFKLYEGCEIQVSTSSDYGTTGANAYIKNLKIIDGTDDVKISVNSADKALGTVTGGGTVAYGESVKVKAVPAQDCEFCYWKDELGNIISYSKSFTEPVYKDATYTAVFRKTEIEKEFFDPILEDEMDVVKKIYMKGGEWTYNRNHILEAPATMNSYSTGPSYTSVEMTVEIPEGKCYQLSAKGNYDSDSYSGFLECAIDGFFNYSDYNYFAQGQENYDNFEPVTLTSGIHTVYFVYYGDATARLKKIAFTELNGDATIKADCIEYLNYEKTELSGEVECSKNQCKIGETVTLKAPSIEGYYFYGWHEYADYGYDNYLSIYPEMNIQVTGDTTYEAYYRKLPEGFVDESMELEFQGCWTFVGKEATVIEGEMVTSFTVEENGANVLCFDYDSINEHPQLSLYVDGELYGVYGDGTKGIVPLSEGTHTVKWIVKNATGKLSNISLLNEDELKELPVTLTVTEYYNCNQSLNDNTEYQYKYGDTTNLDVSAQDYELLALVASDGTVSTNSTIQVLMDGNKNYSAYFTNDACTSEYTDAVDEAYRDSFEFSPSMWMYSSYPYDVIEIQGYQYYPGSSFSAIVTNSEGQSNALSFDYDAESYIGSYEEDIEGYLSVYVNEKEELRIPYDSEEMKTTYQVPLTAGENHVEWKFMLTKDSGVKSWYLYISSLRMEQGRRYAIEVDANDSTYGTVSGNGNYLYNQTVTLKATPNKGYLFKEWQKDGEVVSSEAEYSALVVEDAAYTAVFEVDPNAGGEDEGNEDDGGKDDNGGNDDDNSNNDEHTHTAGGWVIIKEATETESGLKVKKCTTCGEEMEQEIISKKAGNKEEGNKDKHTHTAGDWVITKDATAKESGLKVKKCTICGSEMEQEVIPKYEVSFNVKGTIPLQLRKSTKAIKAVVMEGDKVKSYKSSNPKVAKVNKKGKITAKKTGKAKITVTTKKGATATITIKVQKKPVKTKKITVDKTKLTMEKGQSYTLSVTKTPITSLEKISFTSSNKKVVTVNKKGKIKAKKKGKATITVKCGKKKKKVKVTVQ